MDSVVNLLNRTDGAEHTECLILVDVRANDPVEADEMIDVMVREERTFEVAELRVRQPVILAGIEEHRVRATRIIEVQHRVARRAVDEVDGRESARSSHGYCSGNLVGPPPV